MLTPISTALSRPIEATAPAAAPATTRARAPSSADSFSTATVKPNPVALSPQGDAQATRAYASSIGSSGDLWFARTRPDLPGFDHKPTQDSGDLEIVLGRKAPAIDQHNPAGDTPGSESHRLRDWNCGPAVMAMIARSNGPDATITDSAGQVRRVADMTDDELISEFDKIGATSENGGTSFKGMRAIAAAMGMAVDRSEAWWSNEGEGGDYDPEWINKALEAGKLVAVNGAIHPDPEHPELKLDHYLLIVGTNKEGDYIVNDPWDGSQYVVGQEPLHKYFVDNSVHDGLAIVVG